MSVSATQFRIDLKNLLAGVKRGESYDIVKHSTVIGRLVPGDTVATPDMTISATNVRVKFKDVIVQLNAGSTYHILKHKRVLAALVPADYAASTVDIETVEDEAYNATNDAMDALSEDMNPVTPEIPASEQTFTPSGS
jgi:antitoxin (DNA-binding transcriptional repressor) of toxin-antitoxin stability system